MQSLEEKVKQLPPELQKQVEEYVQLLLEKHEQRPKGKLKLDWRGDLRELRDKYTSVELQHKVLEWWGD